MKNYKLFLKITITGLISINAIIAKAQQSDFSGMWHINRTKTDFKTADGVQTPEYVLSRALKITQNDQNVTVNRTNLTNSLEEKQYTENFSLNTKSSQTVTISGNIETDSVQTHDNQGLIIGISIKSPTNAPVLNFTESWTLEDNGQTLVINKQAVQSDGSRYEIKGYYTKE
jgi:hypothetical protein